MIPWLPPGSDFPPLEEALDDPNGLLAAGNDLAPDTLINAYTRGIFPWYDPSQPVLWWTPNPRCVFRPGDFHISRRLGRHLRNADLTFYLDRDFERVIDVCAAPRDDDGGTWITPEMRAAYLRLHALGHARPDAALRILPALVPEVTEEERMLDPEAARERDLAATAAYTAVLGEFANRGDANRATASTRSGTDARHSQFASEAHAAASAFAAPTPTRASGGFARRDASLPIPTPPPPRANTRHASCFANSTSMAS